MILQIAYAVIYSQHKPSCLMSEKTSGKESQFAQVLMRLMRPVARLALRHSLKLTDLIEMLKIVVVDVAREDLKRAGEDVSVSRLSAMSGVHRKDVTRIVKDQGEYSPPDDLYAKIMVQWEQDKRFSTADGKPRVLSAEGRESEFAALVESVNGGNISAYAVLFEMERSGIVKREGKRVKLCWRDFVVSEDINTGLAMLASDTNDLAVAVEQNLYQRAEIPNLHLKTEFNNIRVDALTDVSRWLIEQGSLFHRKVREYLAQYDCDINPPKSSKVKGGCRIALGAFSLIDNGKSQEQRT